MASRSPSGTSSPAPSATSRVRSVSSDDHTRRTSGPMVTTSRSRCSRPASSREIVMSWATRCSRRRAWTWMAETWRVRNSAEVRAAGSARSSATSEIVVSGVCRLWLTLRRNSRCRSLSRPSRSTRSVVVSWTRASLRAPPTSSAYIENRASSASVQGASAGTRAPSQPVDPPPPSSGASRARSPGSAPPSGVAARPVPSAATIEHVRKPKMRNAPSAAAVAVAVSPSSGCQPATVIDASRRIRSRRSMAATRPSRAPANRSTSGPPGAGLDGRRPAATSSRPPWMVARRRFRSRPTTIETRMARAAAMPSVASSTAGSEPSSDCTASSRVVTTMAEPSEPVGWVQPATIAPVRATPSPGSTRAPAAVAASGSLATAALPSGMTTAASKPVSPRSSSAKSLSSRSTKASRSPSPAVPGGPMGSTDTWASPRPRGRTTGRRRGSLVDRRE